VKKRWGYPPMGKGKRAAESDFTTEQWGTQEFCWGVQQIELRTEDRQNRYLGASAPSQGFWRQL